MVRAKLKYKNLTKFLLPKIKKKCKLIYQDKFADCKILPMSIFQDTFLHDVLPMIYFEFAYVFLRYKFSYIDARIATDSIYNPLYIIIRMIITLFSHIILHELVFFRSELKYESLIKFLLSDTKNKCELTY